MRSVPIKKSSDILSFSAVICCDIHFYYLKKMFLVKLNLRGFIYALLCDAEFMEFLLPTVTGFCTEQSAFSL